LKILFLTQYFPPETGAPQNRLSSLAKYLLLSGNEVSVLTAMPNYPKMETAPGYEGKWYMTEMMDQVRVYRSWIFVTKSKSILMRLLNYWSFMLTSMYSGIVRVPRHDIIICESPPLFLGISGLFIKWIRRSKLIFNVSDLWPESAEKLGLVTNKKVLLAAVWLEEFIYRHADMVTGQTQGIIRNISQRVQVKKYYWLPNGIDFSFFNEVNANTEWRELHNIQPHEILVLYAGIIGHAQALEVIVKAASGLKDKNIKFILVGDGPEKEKLIALAQSLQLDNLYFLPNQPRESMPSIVSACDIFVVPLKKLDIFKVAIPSKLFEPLAYKKPIVLGVDGEARGLFIDEGKAGLYFEPENSDDLARVIEELVADENKRKEFGNNGYNFVKEKFDREKIAEQFHSYLLNNL